MNRAQFLCSLTLFFAKEEKHLGSHVKQNNVLGQSLVKIKQSSFVNSFCSLLSYISTLVVRLSFLGVIFCLSNFSSLLKDARVAILHVYGN